MKILLLCLALAVVALAVEIRLARAAAPFAVTWAHWWNAQSVAHHEPLWITQIGCGPPNGVRRMCDVTVKSRGRVACERLVVLTDYAILASRHMSCGPGALAA